jgi:hypothetical protein
MHLLEIRARAKWQAPPTAYAPRRQAPGRSRRSRHQPIEHLSNRARMVAAGVIVEGDRREVRMPGECARLPHVAVEGVERLKIRADQMICTFSARGLPVPESLSTSKVTF